MREFVESFVYAYVSGNPISLSGGLGWVRSSHFCKVQPSLNSTPEPLTIDFMDKRILIILSVKNLHTKSNYKIVLNQKIYPLASNGY